MERVGEGLSSAVGHNGLILKKTITNYKAEATSGQPPAGPSTAKFLVDPKVADFNTVVCQYFFVEAHLTAFGTPVRNNEGHE